MASVYVMSIFNETRYFSPGLTIVALGLFIFGILLILVSGLLYSFNKQIKNN
jgi:hypothetical protein